MIGSRSLTQAVPKLGILMSGHDWFLTNLIASAAQVVSSLRSYVMRRFFDPFRRFLSDEDGPTAVEYAVMLALVIIVALTTIQTLGRRTSATFDNMAGKMLTS